ncbi:MAG: cytochrome b [Pseudomonadota bacterium]
MAMTNTAQAYGGLTKLFHWLIVILFAWQYFSGNVMTGMERGSLVVGLDQNTYFNWHKSIGLVALAIAIFRIINRSFGPLPDWAPTLGDNEKTFIHRAEQVLYAAMLIMPITGYLYVMAGGYGVLLFGEWKLPNPVGRIEWLEQAAKYIHIWCGYLLAATVAAHILLVMRHQLFMRDGLLWRMWPGQRGE